MISRFGLLKRQPALTPAEFDAHWKQAHGPLAANFPGLRQYDQHLVVDKEHFGIDHARGGWDLDGFSELQFDDLGAMKEAISSEAFSNAKADEDAFLQDLHMLICEKHTVVPLNIGDGPFIKRMTLLKRLPGTSVEEFRHEWLTNHANWVSQWPNVLGYNQNFVVERYHGSRTQVASYEEVPIDGIVEFWFRNKEEAAALYASDVVKRTQEHATIFLDEITPFFVETRNIVEA